MGYRCPACQRVLYNRRLTHCGFCGADIPQHLRFTPEEITALRRELAELEQRRKQRELAADKEAEDKDAKQRAEEIRRLISPM